MNKLLLIILMGLPIFCRAEISLSPVEIDKAIKYCSAYANEKSGIGDEKENLMHWGMCVGMMSSTRELIAYTPFWKKGENCFPPVNSQIDALAIVGHLEKMRKGLGLLNQGEFDSVQKGKFWFVAQAEKARKDFGLNDDKTKQAFLNVEYIAAVPDGYEKGVTFSSLIAFSMLQLFRCN